MQKLVQKLDIPTILKPVYEKMAEAFLANMPKSLYMNYYELEEATGIPNDQWEGFLDIPEIDRYINAKIAKLISFDAKQALNRLASEKNISSSEISALKATIENSKLIQQNVNRQQQIVLMKW